MKMALRNKILLFLIIIFSCNQKFDNLLELIYSSVEDGDLVALEHFTDFEWDNVIICNPGTSQIDFQNFLGKRWSNIEKSCYI